VGTRRWGRSRKNKCQDRWRKKVNNEEKSKDRKDKEEKKKDKRKTPLLRTYLLPRKGDKNRSRAKRKDEEQRRWKR
jgi:hypothetical protein